MIKRLLYILSIYFTNGYFWILMGFISVILLSLVMMSSLQASEICNFAKQIETRNGDKIKSTITQHCWTDKKPIQVVVPLPDILPGYNETILIRQECIGEEIVKHNIKGMEYNCD